MEQLEIRVLDYRDLPVRDRLQSLKYAENMAEMFVRRARKLRLVEACEVVRAALPMADAMRVGRHSVEGDLYVMKVFNRDGVIIWEDGGYLGGEADEMSAAMEHFKAAIDWGLKPNGVDCDTYDVPIREVLCPAGEMG